MIYSFPPQLNRKIGKAMHDFAMIDDGDNILIAISGGIDSLVLMAVLALWQKKAPITFTLTCVHIDHGYSETPFRNSIAPQVDRFSLPLSVIPERPFTTHTKTIKNCFTCAKGRRNHLFDIAQEKRCNKIAFGHHKDDLIETFLLNAIYSGNISTMRPRQDIFDATVAIIRPLSYIDKRDVKRLAQQFELYPIANMCPFAEKSKREKVHNLLEDLYDEEPMARNSLFAALSNVRSDYLLNEVS